VIEGPLDHPALFRAVAAIERERRQPALAMAQQQEPAMHDMARAADLDRVSARGCATVGL
jgi:hypothetical protein